MQSNLTVKIGADIAGLQKELQKAKGQLDVFSKGMKAMGGIMAGAFAADKVIDFGKEVFNVTAEFQKFEAVLTNTLGHNGAAKAALSQITEFAAKTPYAVNELTASFVKLANQGFIPTLDQMRKLGDLAASQGKSFDQLTEAIIDAQTGEFERLKEFGIRASKQGDQVIFTFKGVKTQVDFTAEAMRNYVLSLGDIEGVHGGMEAQSKTLGGGLSNLKDSWEQLTLAIGRAAEKGGIFSGILDMISNGVKTVTKFIDTPTVEENVAMWMKLKDARMKAAAAGDIEEWSRLNNIMQQGTEIVREWYEGQKKLQELQNKQVAASNNAAMANRAQMATAGTTTQTQIGGYLTGAKFLQDAGVVTASASQIKAAIMSINTAVIQGQTTLEQWGEQMRILFEEQQRNLVDFSGVVHSALSGIGSALGNAISGSEKFGHGLLKVVGGVLVQLGGMLITAGLGVEAFKASLKSLNGALAIGAGVALIAMGTAIAGSIQKLGSTGGGGGSGLGSSSGSPRNSGDLTKNGFEIQIGGEMRISGPDLVYIINRQQQLNSRTRGS